MKIRTLFSAALVLFTLVGTGYAEAKTEKVLGGKARITLPSGYEKLSSSALRKAYPSSDRPKEAWYLDGQGGKSMIAFNVFEMRGQKINESHLATIAEGMREELEPYSPTMREGRVNGRKVVWLEVKAPSGRGSERKNMVMLVSAFQGKMLVTSLMIDKDNNGRHLRAGKSALGTLSY